MTQLRIVVTVDPYIPVPPVLYGGIERVVELVVNGLHDRGHDVTLIAHPDSRTPAVLVPYGAPPHFTRVARATELMQVGRALWSRRDRTDVVLSWGRLAALAPILPLRSVPKVQRYCRAGVPWKGVTRAAAIAGSSLTFAGASDSLYLDDLTRLARRGGHWVTAYDGIDTSRYTLQPHVAQDAPLVFLGRLLPEKGAHLAIEVARRAAMPLIIAGNIDEAPHNVAYFEREIAPHIDDDRVRYIGPVDDASKNLLLGRAAALLFTSTYSEPFGLVMVEAMSCGTPVVALRGGSVPEVVRHGISGVIADNVDAMALSVPAALALDRTGVRVDCETRFGAARTIDQFERVLHHAIERA